MAVEEWVNGKDPDFFSSGIMALDTIEQVRFTTC